MGVDSSSRGDASLQSVLAKLEPADRQVVLDALEAAQKTETELRYLADPDPLTALLNRRAFRTRLDTYVNFAARYGGRGAVMVIDLDGLKARIAAEAATARAIYERIVEVPARAAGWQARREK